MTFFNSRSIQEQFQSVHKEDRNTDEVIKSSEDILREHKKQHLLKKWKELENKELDFNKRKIINITLDEKDERVE
jgi:hypothetical protein